MSTSAQQRLFAVDDVVTDEVVDQHSQLVAESNVPTKKSRFANRITQPRPAQPDDGLRLPAQTVQEDQLRNVVIRASAGTGKTFQLSNRFLAQLHAGAAPDEILATTFTRKAAGEILERILIRLAEAASSDAKCRELAGFIGANNLSRPRCMRLLETVTLSLHRIRVSTLDSFFSQIASSFGLELGLPPGWRIVDDLSDRQLREQAIEIVLGQDSAKDVSRLMNMLSKGAAQRSVSQLLHSTVDALYQTFLDTDQSAWEQFPEVSPMNAYDLDETLENLRTLELPADKRLEAARSKDYAAASGYQWEDFVKVRGIARKVEEGATTYYKKEIQPHVRAVYERLLKHVRAVIIDLLAKQTGATHDLLGRFHTVYDRLKREVRALRFDDVTRKVAQAGREIDTGQLSYRLDSRIRHLLLDEFQDTSLAQWHVLRPFAHQVTDPCEDPMAELDPLEAQLVESSLVPAEELAAARRSFFCVGDVKQAIYGWRGGIAEIFDAIESELHGINRQSLNRSFRSSQPVIDAVNQIFANMRRHELFESVGNGVLTWLEQFEPHSTARTELSGHVSLKTAPAPPDENVYQQSATLRFAAEQVSELNQQNPGRTIGVLARRNRVVGRMIFELRRLGVSASEESGNPLTDSPAVELILSLLHAADHPGDLAARLHIAKSPLASHLKFTEHANDQAADQLSLFVRSELVTHGYGPTVAGWSRTLAESCNRRDLSRLEQLVELAYGFQPNATLRTRDFVDFVRTQRVADQTGDDVRVMTVHQSKGLQFDIVVLVDLDVDVTGQPPAFVTGQPKPTDNVDRVVLYRNADIQRMLPENLRESFEQTRDRQITEGLCVLYVALTRAIHGLHMIIAPSSDSERKLPQSAAGILRVALTDGSPASPNKTLYEHGEPYDGLPSPSPHERVVEPTTTDLEVRRTEPVPAPVRIRLAESDARRRGMTRETPSGREGGRKVKLSNILRLGNAAAMERGTLIHAWFELIHWLDNERWPEERRLREVADQIGATNLDVGKHIREFHAMLRTPKIAWTLYRKSYQPPRELNLPPDVLQEIATAKNLVLEVQNERSFAIRDNNTVISGIIDRLVLISDGDRLLAADIVDFKTDSVSAADPKALRDRIEHYRAQLQTYRPAVARIFKLPVERISARLLMVGAGIVVST